VVNILDLNRGSAMSEIGSAIGAGGDSGRT
jgi:hypothetical protein